MVAESRAVAVTTDGPWTQAQLDLIRRTVAADANKDELALFLYQAQRTGLDPLARQIHCVKRGNKIAIQVAIDGYRLIADRTGKYAGNDDPVYQMPAGMGEDSDHAHPAKATVTVWKIVSGVRCAFTATARWEEYCPEGTQAFMWRKMPFLMLAKCFDEQTELLTDEGFQPFGSVSGHVLQVTDQGLQVTGAKPFSQHYAGPMVTMESDDLNFCVTPNHDMLTTEGRLEAGQLYERARARPQHWIPRCVPGSSCDWLMPDAHIRLAAAYLADGSDISKRKFRIEVSRPRKVELLRDIGWANTEHPRSTAGQVVSTATRTITTRQDKTQFVYDFAWIDFLCEPGKVVNREHLLYLSKRQLRLFVDTLIDFDGHVSKEAGVRRFYTSRPDLLAAFEVAAIGAGYAISRPKARQSDISRKNNYWVTVSARSEIPVTRWGRDYHGDKGGHLKHTGLNLVPNASGKVWCVTVPSGLIVVRRNGFSMVCGNCAESAALRKAFPAELSGVYTQEEMDQAEVVEATVRMQPVPPTQQASQSARPAQARPPATTCADCGKTIVDAQIGTKVYKAASVEQGAIKEFGRALCYSCGQREAAKRQGQAHEAAVQGQAVPSAPLQGEIAAEAEDRAF